MRVASFLSITACAGPVLLLSCSSSLLPSFLLPRVKGRLEAEDENKATKQRAAEGRRIMLLQSRLLVEVVDDESKGRTCRSVFVDRARIIAVLVRAILSPCWCVGQQQTNKTVLATCMCCCSFSVSRTSEPFEEPTNNREATAHKPDTPTGSVHPLGVIHEPFVSSGRQSDIPTVLTVRKLG